MQLHNLQWIDPLWGQAKIKALVPGVRNTSPIAFALQNKPWAAPTVREKLLFLFTRTTLVCCCIIDNTSKGELKVFIKKCSFCPWLNKNVWESHFVWSKLKRSRNVICLLARCSVFDKHLQGLKSRFGASSSMACLKRNY